MTSVYQRALGNQFNHLPPVLQTLHQDSSKKVYGTLNIKWSRHQWVRALLSCLSLPKAQNNASCTVLMHTHAQTESWQRNIAGSRLRSNMSTQHANYVIERLAILRFNLYTRLSGHGLQQRSQQVYCLGIRLPFVHVFARERAIDANTYRCNVKIIFSYIGCVLHYQGRLQVQVHHAD